MKICKYILLAALALASVESYGFSISKESSSDENTMLSTDILKSRFGKQNEHKITQEVLVAGKKKRGLTPPTVLKVLNEGHNSMNIFYDPDSAPIVHYCIGTNDKSDKDWPADIKAPVWLGKDPKRDDVGYIHSFSLTQANSVLEGKGRDPLKIGDTLFINIRSANADQTEWGEWKSIPFVITKKELGREDYDLSYYFTHAYGQGDFSSITKQKMVGFLPKMFPILKEVYGPPALPNNVGIVMDQKKTSTNVYMHSPDWILKDDKYNPQLLTHEFVHAMRDFACLSSNSYWEYDPELSGFEESFAQAVSFVVMNRYLNLYPNDAGLTEDNGYVIDRPIVGKFNWTYDYKNVPELTTKDFMSAGGDGTGTFTSRYEMGADAILKIWQEIGSLDDSNFSALFNKEYYKRLNSDIYYHADREEIIDIIDKVLLENGKDGNKVEGVPFKKWVNNQRIFDCKIKTGFKIYKNSDYKNNMNGLNHGGHVFYYETFNNGSEWTTDDNGDGVRRMHRVNGAKGYAKITNSKGEVVFKQPFATVPDIQPPVGGGEGTPGYLFASKRVDFTTALYNQPTGKGYIDAKIPKTGWDTYYPIRDSKNVGVYVEEYMLDHKNGLPTVMRNYFVTGDTIRLQVFENKVLPGYDVAHQNFDGVIGAAIDDDGKIGENVNYLNGQIYFQHENYLTEDGPFEVKDGAFWGRTQFTGKYLYEGNVDTKRCQPGRVFVRFINKTDGKEYRSQRNITYGDLKGNPRGNQLFLFRFDVNNSSLIQSEDAKSLELNQNYPNPFNPTTTINFSLKENQKLNLSVYNVKGELVQTLLNGNLNEGNHSVSFDGSKLNSGVYFYKLIGKNINMTKKMMLIK